MKFQSYLSIYILSAIVQTVVAQISPPGVDNAKVVGWAALGINQQLAKKWSITVYAGGSRQSDPDNYNPMRKVGIYVVNQETLYSFNSSWQLAFCNSVRVQDVYEEEKPYELRDPGIRNELRYYLRLFYKRKTKRTSFTYSVRPEYRTFYTSNWDQWSTPQELRLRIKGQANISLNESKSNQFILANEVLTAIDHYQHATESHDEWSSYHFTEDRFSNYFRHTFSKPSFIVDAGLMHQFWKNKSNNDLNYTMYMAIDLLFTNPFGTK